MHVLILIEKDSPASGCWLNLTRKKKILELSVEKVVNKYQGFEGELISFFEIKENKINLNIINECLELRNLGNCLLLHVISGPAVVPPILKELAFKVGYDVGVCEEEKTIYSSIYNEILFGIINELIIYKDVLNESLLFPDRSLAEKYVSIHNEMSIQGKDVEDYEEMTIYEIWKHKDNI